MTWPRGWALSEVFWTPDEKKNWADFVSRTENQFKRSDVAEIKYSKAIYDAMIKTHIQDNRLRVEMGTEVPGLDIFYTIDGGMPDNFSPKYSQAFEIPEGPVTLRVITYRNGLPIGHLITLTPEELRKRAE